jgi:hypothetical protein
MYKWLGLFLLLTTSAFASISVTSGSNSDGYTYDLAITLTDDLYIDASDFGGAENAGTDSKLYYQVINVTPSATGSYFFDNWDSSLSANGSTVTETELLFYLEIPTDYSFISAPPWAFRSSSGGFGGGLNNSIQTPDRGENATYDGFYGELTLEKDVKYIAVFTSFQADTLGSMDVNVIGNDQLSWAAIPEPSTYALLFGWIAFLYIAIKRR